MQYLDKAMGGLRDLGLLPARTEEAPIVGLLERITDLDPDKIAVITRTLSQMSVFNEVVREQISEMSIGERYEKITQGFNSIRDDAKAMVDQISDGKLDLFERATNTWMKISRGDIASRFDSIRETYLEVARDTKTNIEREQIILEAYRDFRGALKQAEVAALEVLKSAEAKLAVAKDELGKASEAVAGFAGTPRPSAERLKTAYAMHSRALAASGLDPSLAQTMCTNCAGCDLVPGRD